MKDKIDKEVVVKFNEFNEQVNELTNFTVAILELPPQGDEEKEATEIELKQRIKELKNALHSLVGSLKTKIHGGGE
jgi:hypothetical protein